MQISVKYYNNTYSIFAKTNCLALRVFQFRYFRANGQLIGAFTDNATPHTEIHLDWSKVDQQRSQGLQLTDPNETVFRTTFQPILDTFGINTRLSVHPVLLGRNVPGRIKTLLASEPS